MINHNNTLDNELGMFFLVFFGSLMMMLTFAICGTSSNGRKIRHGELHSRQ